MQAFDTSSIVYAWDNYPPGQFPRLWDWMAGEINSVRLKVPYVAVDEILNVAPDCHGWLQGRGVQVMPMTNEIVAEAFRIKGLLGIVNDAFGAGVGENDLYIIATAKCNGIELISNEAVQSNLPQKMHNCKIPAVCGLDTVGVPHLSFLDFIKRSGAVF